MYGEQVFWRELKKVDKKRKSNVPVVAGKKFNKAAKNHTSKMLAGISKKDKELQDLELKITEDMTPDQIMQELIEGVKNG